MANIENPYLTGRQIYYAIKNADELVEELKVALHILDDVDHISAIGILQENLRKEEKTLNALMNKEYIRNDKSVLGEGVLTR